MQYVTLSFSALCVSILFMLSPTSKSCRPVTDKIMQKVLATVAYYITNDSVKVNNLGSFRFVNL